MASANHIMLMYGMIVFRSVHTEKVIGLFHVTWH